MEIEDKLVARTWDDPIKNLPEAAAFAAEALRQMGCAFEALPENANPFVWPIFAEERELVAQLQQKHPADSETLVKVADLLRRFSEEATVDEIAVAAIKALKWAAFRAEHAVKNECSVVATSAWRVQ
jgi:hypothetical protein